MEWQGSVVSLQAAGVWVCSFVQRALEGERRREREHRVSGLCLRKGRARRGRRPSESDERTERETEGGEGEGKEEENEEGMREDDDDEKRKERKGEKKKGHAIASQPSR